MRNTMLLLVLMLSLAQCATRPAPAAADAVPRVARMWRGEVPLARAEEYDAYIRAEGLNKLRAIPGNLGVQMFRRTVGDREELVVISYWPDEAAIRAYAGDDITRARLIELDGARASVHTFRTWSCRSSRVWSLRRNRHSGEARVQ